MRGWRCSAAAIRVTEVTSTPTAGMPIGGLPSSTDGSLFDGDRLGEVAWLVHVAATLHGDVVREQLQRDDIDQWRQQLVADRDLDDVPGEVGIEGVLALAHQGDDRSLARAHLLHIAH